MRLSFSEMIKTKMNLLQQMHNFILNIGDEEIYEEWVTSCVPDEPSEDDYEFIASNEILWNEITEKFIQIIKRTK